MKSKANVAAKVTRIVETVERPFMSGGEHAGRRSCWVEVELMGEQFRFHVKAPFFDKLKDAGVPVAKYASAFERHRVEKKKSSHG